ncbi:MAG: hypothetical protein K2Q26_05035 [Bdellovibrionales bacterium]|nr:hypothetical protein [Bdellovibrionales bacterium]
MTIWQSGAAWLAIDLERDRWFKKMTAFYPRFQPIEKCLTPVPSRYDWTLIQ